MFVTDATLSKEQQEISNLPNSKEMTHEKAVARQPLANW
jgi:hypothetical protein